jgi:uncharacterized membrane protein YhaH (DUF805 family)
MTGIIEAIRSGLQQYRSASGRATRAEFWWWFAFYLLLQALLGDSPLGVLVVLGLLLPTVTVMIRRLHDTDRSGWFTLIGFIPVAGVFILLVLLALPSTQGSNRYGPPRTPTSPPTNPWQSGGPGGTGGWGGTGGTGGSGGWGGSPGALGGLDRPGRPGGNWDDTPGGAGGGETPPPPPPSR